MDKSNDCLNLARLAELENLSLEGFTSRELVDAKTVKPGKDEIMMALEMREGSYLMTTGHASNSELCVRLAMIETTQQICNSPEGERALRQRAKKLGII